MNSISLRVSDIFNMSFGQVFVAGNLEGESALVGPSRWKLLVNNQEIGELEAIGEQLPKGARPGQRIVSYKGQIDTSALNLVSDSVILVKVEE